MIENTYAGMTAGTVETGKNKIPPAAAVERASARRSERATFVTTAKARRVAAVYLFVFLSLSLFLFATSHTVASFFPSLLAERHFQRKVTMPSGPGAGKRNT